MREGSWAYAIGIRLLGLLLLPSVWGFMQGGYALLVNAQKVTATQGGLALFGLGMLVWLAIYFFLTPSARSYVIAHECSHLLAAWVSGVRAGNMQIGRNSGSVQVAKTSIWIALAPYMIPFYSLLLLMVHLLASLWWDPTAWQALLPPALGFTWCFHLTFTLQALSIGQSDLDPYGWLGGMPLILLANLLLLCLALSAATPEPFSTDLWVILDHLGQVHQDLFQRIPRG